MLCLWIPRFPSYMAKSLPHLHMAGERFFSSLSLLEENKSRKNKEFCRRILHPPYIGVVGDQVPTNLPSGVTRAVSKGRPLEK